jgi:hypothetical protein
MRLPSTSLALWPHKRAVCGSARWACIGVRAVCGCTRIRVYSGEARADAPTRQAIASHLRTPDAYKTMNLFFHVFLFSPRLVTNPECTHVVSSAAAIATITANGGLTERGRAVHWQPQTATPGVCTWSA